MKKIISSIAVYGYGKLGEHFINAIQDSPVCIKYIIDKRK